jgi:hypothetical protein
MDPGERGVSAGRGPCRMGWTPVDTEHGAADGRGLAEGRDPGRRPRTSPLVGGKGHGQRVSRFDSIPGGSYDGLARGGS